MADVTFTVSAAFLTRARAAIVAENPALAGQTVTQLNEAARQRFKQSIIEWLIGAERLSAAKTAASQITTPTSADIS